MVGQKASALIAFRLPADLKAALDEEAQRCNTDPSALIREALEDRLYKMREQDDDRIKEACRASLLVHAGQVVSRTTILDSLEEDGLL